MNKNQGIPNAMAREIELLRKENALLKSKLNEKAEIDTTENFYLKTYNKLLEQKAAIEERTHYYQLLIENALDGVFLLNDRNFTFVNSKFCEITAYSQSELIGSNFNFQNIIAEQSKQIVEQAFKSRIHRNTNADTCEISIIQKGGAEKIVEIASIPIPGDDANTILGIIKDNTQKRKMEREIACHVKVQSLLMNLSIRFLNIPYSNIDSEIDQALADIGNYSAIDRAYIFAYDWDTNTMTNTHEWCAKGIDPVIDTLQSIPNSIVPLWIEAHKAGDPIQITSVDKLSDSDKVKMILTLQNVKSLITFPMMFEKQCLGFVGFDSVGKEKRWTEQETTLLKLFAELLVNVQVKANYEKWLKEAKTIAEIRQAEVRNIVDYSPTGIAHLSLSGKVLEINQAALNMLGAPSVEVVKSQNIYSNTPLKKYGFIADFERCIETKAMVSNETKYTSTWHMTFYIKYTLMPIIIDDTVKSVLANVEDISSVKETEHKLIALKERAEASDKLKSAFLANMSHEIRTPMNAICGFSNLLLEDSISDDQKREFVEIINLNGHQLLNIINDIIDISKIEAGQVSLSKAKFSVNKMLNDLKAVFSQTARIKGLDLLISMGLPDSQSVIFTDEVKLSQVLNNLIFNAIKFTNTGAIEIGYKVIGKQLEFYVKDTGIGIEPEQSTIIFKRFQQVDNATNSSRKGTGLGLPISKAFVEMLGGKIWFTSTPNVGTCFYFTIPYIEGLTLNLDENTSTNNNLLWSDKTILIAEDDDPNYQYLEHLLKSANAKVIRAINGQEAIDRCVSNKIDLILMDIKMPIMNGIDATKELRKRGFTMPIVAQTAHAMQEDKQLALSSGCNAFTTKPIESKELFRIILSVLQAE
jgi:PAS domain S-box-containing protein